MFITPFCNKSSNSLVDAPFLAKELASCVFVLVLSIFVIISFKHHCYHSYVNLQSFFFDVIASYNDLLLVYVSIGNNLVPLNNNSDTISDM